jgi:di/tricarboxylate transporter
MTPDVDFCLAFAVSIVATYALWCLDRMPRVRALLVLVGVICFVIALSMRHDFFAAPDSKPAVPMYRDQNQN